MAFTPVNVVRSYLRGQAPAQGWVSLRPSVAMVNGDTEVKAPTTRYLDDAGHVVVPVVAYDDPDTEPAGVAHQVTEMIRGARPRTFSVFISRTAGSVVDGVRTIDLATLDELTEPPALVAPLRLIRAAADLDLTGAVVGRAIVITALDPLTFGFADVTAGSGGGSGGDGTYSSTYTALY